MRHCKTLKKECQDTDGAVVFGSNDGEQFLFRRVNREFEQAKGRKPTYYLSELVRGESKYFSGVFATEFSPRVFTADKRNEIGMKELFALVFFEAGTRIEMFALSKYDEVVGLAKKVQMGESL